MAIPLRLTVNGAAVEVADVPDSERLLDTLRWRMGLKGTKEGCRSGSCGACTIVVAGRSVLSCLTLSREIDGSEVLTIEGAESDPVGRRVQRAFEAEAALQCGYCTPGFVMALVGRLKEPRRDEGSDSVLTDLNGNICRCTGYAAIERAVRRAKEPLP